MLNMDQHCNFFGQRRTLNEDFFLKYIDIAMDYAGSFDREKVIDYMVILCKYGASLIGTISRSDSDFDETCWQC